MNERARPGFLGRWPGRVRSHFTPPVATFVRPAGLPRDEDEWPESPAQHAPPPTTPLRTETAPDLPDASVLGQIVDDRPAMRLDDPFDLGPSVLAKSPRENDPPPAAHHLTASWCQGDVGITHIEALPQIRLGRRGGVLIGKRSCQDMHRR